MDNIVFVLHSDLKCIFQENSKVFLKVHKMVSLNIATKQQHKIETVLRIGCFGLVTRSGVLPPFSIVRLLCAASCALTYSCIAAVMVFFWVGSPKDCRVDVIS